MSAQASKSKYIWRIVLGLSLPLALIVVGLVIYSAGSFVYQTSNNLGVKSVFNIISMLFSVAGVLGIIIWGPILWISGIIGLSKTASK